MYLVCRLLLECHDHPPHLHSFPTRRSSDLPIPTTQQTFTDVPLSNAFWLYTERAYVHGVIGGYTSSPPCTTGVPCFLPGASVTRGQTAKFKIGRAHV